MEANAQQIKASILKRKSIFSFDSKNINQEILQELFEAARWSASAFNEQPWRFIYASRSENEKVFNQILDLLVPANRAWAQHAPVLMLVVAKSAFAANGKPNIHALYDTGQAVSAFAIQAAAHEIYLHQMAGFDREKAIDDFKLGSAYIPATVVAMGYMGNIDHLPENLKQRALNPRNRKVVSEIAFQEIEEFERTH